MSFANLKGTACLASLKYFLQAFVKIPILLSQPFMGDKSLFRTIFDPSQTNLRDSIVHQKDFFFIYTPQ